MYDRCCQVLQLRASLLASFPDVRLLLFWLRSRTFVCFSFRFVPGRSFASLLASFPNVCLLRLGVVWLRLATFRKEMLRLASFGNVRFCCLNYCQHKTPNNIFWGAVAWEAKVQGKAEKEEKEEEEDGHDNPGGTGRMRSWRSGRGGGEGGGGG